MKALLITSALFLSIGATFAWAQPPKGHGPPPEAIEACQNAEEGAACSFESPHGTLEGTCASGEEGMACRPADAPPPGGGPPPEALEACEGKSSTDSCSFTTPHGDDLSGSCRMVEDDQLACVPADHDKRHGRHGRHGDRGRR